MSFTMDCVKAIERRYGCATGKEIAELLGVVEMSVSRYRNGQKGFSDEVALRAASLLDMSEAIMLIRLQEERAETPEVRKAWHQIAQKLRVGAGEGNRTLV